MRRNAQISIFIIIMLMVIVLFVFLFSSVGDIQQQELDETTAALKVDTNEVRLLQDHVDSCLDIQLKRSLVLAGYQGGFLYEQGSLSRQLYKNTIIHPEIYSDKFLQNIDLNSNMLTAKTLLHHSTEVLTPSIETALGSGTIYTNSIEQDFERFMKDEFLRCMDLDAYRAQGYEVQYEQFSGFMQDLEYDPLVPLIRAEVEGLEGIVGDNVAVTVGSEYLQGEIVQALDSSGISIVEFTTPENTPEQLEFLATTQVDITSLLVANTDSEITIDVEFEEEDVVATLYFPIVFTSQNTVLSVKKAQQIANVRFKKLLELSEALLREKESNKAVDYSDVAEINRVLSQGQYLSTTQLNELSFTRFTINESEEYKHYIYSFIDGNSKLSGQDYIFNFGYENHAPFVDLAAAGFIADSEDNTFYVLVPTNKTFTFDIEDIEEFQTIDTFRSHYVAQTVVDVDAEFELTEAGQITFIGYQQRRYVYDVELTDDEATRTYTIVFLAGLPDNTNNQAAHECFSFETGGGPYYSNFDTIYPVISETKDIVHNYENTDGSYRAFAMSFHQYFGVQGPPWGFLEFSRLYFRPSCYFNPDNFNIDIEAIDRDTNTDVWGGYDVDTGEIHVGNYRVNPELKGPIDVKVELTYEGQVVTEPFEMTIYTAGCLGPDPYSPTAISTLNLGGDGSCCDTTVLRSIVVGGQDPESLIPNTLDNLEGSSETALYTPMYFTFTMENEFDDFTVDYENKVIWNELPNGASPTSLYSGILHSQCGGTFPMWEHNLQGIEPTGTTRFTDYVKAFQSENGIYRESGDIENVEFAVTELVAGGICEFVHLTNDPEGFSLVLRNGLPFFASFAAQTNYNLGPQLDPTEKVLCEPPDVWYGTHDNTLNWVSLGFQPRPYDAYKSRSYCKINEMNCGRYIKDSSDPNLYRPGGSCTQWSGFNGDNLFSTQITQGTDCDFTIDASDGLCYVHTCNAASTCEITTTTVAVSVCDDWVDFITTP